MANLKDEAFYEAQAAEAASALTQIRRPKLEAALASVEELNKSLPTLVEHRDGLHEGNARRALSNVISILTSAPDMVRHELSAATGGGE